MFSVADLATLGVKHGIGIKLSGTYKLFNVIAICYGVSVVTVEMYAPNPGRGSSFQPSKHGNAGTDCLWAAPDICVIGKAG